MFLKINSTNLIVPLHTFKVLFKVKFRTEYAYLWEENYTCMHSNHLSFSALCGIVLLPNWTEKVSALANLVLVLLRKFHIWLFWVIYNNTSQTQVSKDFSSGVNLGHSEVFWNFVYTVDVGMFGVKSDFQRGVPYLGVKLICT